MTVSKYNVTYVIYCNSYRIICTHTQHTCSLSSLHTTMRFNATCNILQQYVRAQENLPVLCCISLIKSWPAVPSSCSSALNASLASTGSSGAHHKSRRQGQDQLHLDDIGARTLVASLSSGVSCPCVRQRHDQNSRMERSNSINVKVDRFNS